jgi:hypothetical protein
MRALPIGEPVKHKVRAASRRVISSNALPRFALEVRLDPVDLGALDEGEAARR